MPTVYTAPGIPGSSGRVVTYCEECCWRADPLRIVTPATAFNGQVPPILYITFGGGTGWAAGLNGISIPILLNKCFDAPAGYFYQPACAFHVGPAGTLNPWCPDLLDSGYNASDGHLPDCYPTYSGFICADASDTITGSGSPSFGYPPNPTCVGSYDYIKALRDYYFRGACQCFGPGFARLNPSDPAKSIGGIILGDSPGLNNCTGGGSFNCCQGYIRRIDAFFFPIGVSPTPGPGSGSGSDHMTSLIRQLYITVWTYWPFNSQCEPQPGNPFSTCADFTLESGSSSPGPPAFAEMFFGDCPSLVPYGDPPGRSNSIDLLGWVSSFTQLTGGCEAFPSYLYTSPSFVLGVGDISNWCGVSFPNTCSCVNNTATVQVALTGTATP